MATKKLTKDSIAALPVPEQGQSYFWDTETKGFGCVVGHTGVRSFCARAWVGAKKRRVTIGVVGSMRSDGREWTVMLARAEARVLLGRMSSGEDPNATKRKSASSGPTLRDGLELHLRNMRAGKNRRKKVCSPRSVHKIETEVPRHLGEWLDRPIVDLTAFELQKVLDRIESKTPAITGAVNKPGVAQANKIIAHVRVIWGALDTLHDLPVKNPAKRLRESALLARDTRIDKGGFVEWHAKVQAMENPVRRDLQLVSLFSGIRSDGICHLRWEDVDFDEDLLQVRKAKGDKPYTLPMTKTVRDILEKRRNENASEFAERGGDHGWCFPSLSRDMKDVIAVAEPKERRTVKAETDEDGDAKRIQYLPGIHANRRTFNSVAMEIGIPIEPRETLMNHSGRGVNVVHYGRPQNWDYVRECAEKIEAALWQRLKPSTTKPRLRSVA